MERVGPTDVEIDALTTDQLNEIKKSLKDEVAHVWSRLIFLNPRVCPVNDPKGKYYCDLISDLVPPITLHVIIKLFEKSCLCVREHVTKTEEEVEEDVRKNIEKKRIA
jgi:hypothetical protein